VVIGRVVHPHPSGRRRLALQEGTAWAGPRLAGRSPRSAVKGADHAPEKEGAAPGQVWLDARAQ
jgi:hypothetical protein